MRCRSHAHGVAALATVAVFIVASFGRATAATTTVPDAPTTVEAPTSRPPDETTERPPVTISRPTVAQPTSPAPATAATATSVPVTSATPSSSSTPWGWLAVGIAAVAAVALLIAGLMGRSRRRTDATQWLSIARPARDDAVIARDLLVNVERAAPLAEPVKRQVDAAAIEVDNAGRAAPDGDRRDAASSVAAALRGLLFAIEAEALLRTSASAPTAEQLSQADVTHRARTHDLDVALARLDALVQPVRN